MSREVRQVTVTDLRFDDSSPGDPFRFSALVLRYGVVDTYGTVFTPGVFTDSLTTRMPRICWSHDWADPIGRWVSWTETSDGLELVGELDDFDAVPRARQAAAQLRSGTIDQFSVGFVRLSDEPAGDDFPPGVRAITEGLLDEVSLVLVGSVPGTRPVTVPRSAAAGLSLSVRMPGAGSTLMVPVDAATQIILQMQHGDLDLADGLQALKQAATATAAGTAAGNAASADSDVDAGGVDTEDSPADAADVDAADVDAGDDALFAEADELLAAHTGGA